ncbi:MAG: hypothetical protein R3E66_14505 [bacterium]
MNWMNVSALSLIVLLAACGDDAASKSTTDANNTNTSNNTGNNTTVTPTTSFDVSVGDNTYQREVDNAQATQESAAAVIAQNLVNLYMVSTDGVSISAVVETTPNAPAPGSFTTNPPPEGTFVSFINAATGQGYDSVSGTIRLDSCPKAVGEKLKGGFVGVQLQPVTGGEAITLDGDFDLAVIAKNGDLNCVATSSNNTVQNNTNANNQTCSADQCQDGGLCCPYVPCLSQCELDCFTSTACLMGDVIGCAQCADACVTTCEVSNECATALQALNACEERSSCDAFGDESVYDQCMQSNCCSELSAAL